MKIATYQVCSIMPVKVIPRMDLIVFGCRIGKWPNHVQECPQKGFLASLAKWKKNRHPCPVYFENSKAYQEPRKWYISFPLSLRSWNAKLWAHFERHAGPESKGPSFSAKLVHSHQSVKSHQTVPPNACKNHFPVSHKRWVTEILTWCMFFMSVQ